MYNAFILRGGIYQLNIIGRRYWFFLLSLIIIIPGVISLFIQPGLRLGVDFTGGTLWEIKFDNNISTDQVREVLINNGVGDSLLQDAGSNTIIIRSKEITSGSEIKQLVELDLKRFYGEFIEMQFVDVGPTVGAEVAQSAIWAVLIASIGILLYITYAFRKVSSPFKYGICAIVALVHDAIVVIGIFSILGKFFNIEVDALFVTALLTIIGFSVHDTIVVFDRIRENVSRFANSSFEDVANFSVVQTLGRSLTTSLTVVITLTALLLFGGATIKVFVMTLVIGIIVGTYSSIFVASSLLVSWQNGDILKLFKRRSNSAKSAVITN